MERTISITVDIEDWYHIPSVTGFHFSFYKTTDEFFSKWSGRYDYLTEPTMTILDILSSYNIKATFFVVGDVVNKYPGLVEEIAKKGHEIACHGLYHSCKIDPKTKKMLVTPEEFEKRTMEARLLLEYISGKPVVGYRAPNALISGWMIDSLERLGFKYDSSVSANSLYNKTDSQLLGVRTEPYYPDKGGLEPGEKRGIVEFPFASWNVGGFRIPASGGPMLRFLGKEVVSRGLFQSMKHGHAVFYIHPIDISTEKFPVIGTGRPFYWAIKGSVVEKRFRAILDRLEPVENIPLCEAVQRYRKS
jgi:peptidoglycan/xylan/chitin deacetylase (PgdA/CDA1 family)